MIDINPETIRYIISQAHQFQTGGDSLFMEDQASPLDEEIADIQDDTQFDSTGDQFKAVIGDLEPDQQQTIVALMWLGRGDFSLEEWDDAVEAAAQSWNDQTAEYLIATPQLGDYLSEGLAMHGYTDD